MGFFLMTSFEQMRVLIVSFGRLQYANQAQIMRTLSPRQHLLHLRPQILFGLPKARRCEVPCRESKKAPREETKSTAMPLAVEKVFLIILHSTKTCPKKSTIRQVPQEAVISRPKSINYGVHGALRTVEHTTIQQLTVRC